MAYFFSSLRLFFSTQEILFRLATFISDNFLIQNPLGLQQNKDGWLHFSITINMIFISL